MAPEQIEGRVADARADVFARNWARSCRVKVHSNGRANVHNEGWKAGRRTEMNTLHLPGFTAEHSVYSSRAHYNTTTTNRSGVIDDIRPQRFNDSCGSLSRMIQHYYYLYGLDVTSGDHASALQQLQKIKDLEALLAFC
jgi:hypothetical protein